MPDDARHAARVWCARAIDALWTLALLTLPFVMMLLPALPSIHRAASAQCSAASAFAAFGSALAICAGLGGLASVLAWTVSGHRRFWLTVGTAPLAIVTGIVLVITSLS